MKPHPLPLLLAALFLTSLHAHIAHAAEPAKAETTATVLRALLAAANETIPAENQHCNLGSNFAPGTTKPVKITEPLITQLAEMSAGGDNRIESSCDETQPKTCRLFLAHALGEVESTTEYRFQMVDGKAKADSISCVSTP